MWTFQFIYAKWEIDKAVKFVGSVHFFSKKKHQWKASKNSDFF